MDPRLLYGYGVTILGVGNLGYGVAQFVTNAASIVVWGAEIVVGLALFTIGVFTIREDDALDVSRLSPRTQRVIGWVGLLIGSLMIVMTAMLLY